MSNKFIYRFQSILNIKDKVEESKKHDFGVAIKKLDTEKKHLNVLKSKRKEIIDELNNKSSKVIKVQEFRNISHNLDLIEKSINKQNNLINNQEKKVDICKSALIDAKKETKIFEKIKDKDLTDFKYKEAKHEEMLIDHFVSYKSSRK